jgi:hypothetical protein
VSRSKGKPGSLPMLTYGVAGLLSTLPRAPFSDGPDGRGAAVRRVYGSNGCHLRPLDQPSEQAQRGELFKPGLFVRLSTVGDQVAD